MKNEVQMNGLLLVVKIKKTKLSFTISFEI